MSDLILARLDAIGLALILGAAILGLPLCWLIHCSLQRICIWHAQRFCRQRHFNLCRCRGRPNFNYDGVKTEFTLVEIDGFDNNSQRRLIRLLVWIFGVRKVLCDQAYPESYDLDWPPAGIN